MKLFMKLLLVLLVLAVLAPFAILKDNNGKPLMSVSDIKMPDLSVPDIPDMVDEIPAEAGQQSVIYQWTDANGSLNFTTEPPPEGVAFTKKTFDPDANVIQSVKPKAETSVVSKQTNDSGAMAASSGEAESGISNPYSPQKIEKLFDDARSVEKKLNERVTNQQQILDNL